MDKEFKQSIDERQAAIGIIGLGYVGIPLVLEFVDKGFKTFGFDIDQSKVDSLLSGKTYINHIPAKSIQALNQSGKFYATTDFSLIEGVDVILICVPTPLSDQREPDISYIVSTGETIYPFLKRGQLVVLESTTYPGTTEEVLLPVLEKSGLKCGDDLHLAYSPEREDPGNSEFPTRSIPKIIGGHTTEALERASYLYGQIVVGTVPVSSTRTAEAVKILENVFRSVNIALMNELKIIYSKMGIDVWEVIDAAKSKPFGFMPFYPGPGLGGHCIPIDPFYLTWKAREYGCSTRFIELAGEINTAMPMYVVQKLTGALNDRKKALKGSSILIIGLSYKEDIDDIRESPSLELLKILKDSGAKAAYHDPFVPAVKKTRKYQALEGLKRVDLTPETIRNYDAIIISTAHTSIDYDELVRHAQVVIDTRNATKNVKEGREKIIKA